MKTIQKIISEISTLKTVDIKPFLQNLSLDDVHNIKTYADDIYYNTGEDSGLSDSKYDIILEYIVENDKNYIPPIGAKLRDDIEKINLEYWLGSMNKFKPENINEIERWQKNNKSNDYVLSSKLDGMSALLIIEKGRMKIYTRGDDDGLGTDISVFLKYIKNIPKHINKKVLEKIIGKNHSKVAIRGELVIKSSTFLKKYKKDPTISSDIKQKDKYKNPRNMMSGLVATAKTSRAGLNDIDFVTYEIIDPQGYSQEDQLEYLKQLGFLVVKHEFIKNLSVPNLMKKLINFRIESEYEIDGIIINVNKSYDRNTDGNPSYSFAFKMDNDDDEIETIVLEVIWNISKNALVKPRIRVKPVDINGATIEYVTGHNAKFIYDNNIGKGTIIKLIRSGEVIPYIKEVLKPSKQPDMPDIKYSWNETHVDIYVDEGSDDQCIKRLASFFGNLKFENMGEKTIEKIYNNGYKTLFDILNITIDDLLEIDTFKEKSSTNIYNGIQEKLNGQITKEQFLGETGVFGPGIGTKIIKVLFKKYPKILDKKYETNELYGMILSVDGFSDVRAEQIIEGISDAVELINEFETIGTLKKIKKESKKLSKNKKESLNNKIVVMTGFRDKDLSEEIESLGGEVKSDVSSKTNILIVKIKDLNPSGKVKKAMDKGVEIMTKDEFINKYI